MAFLIGGANSLADTGYNITNSLRFDGDSYQSRDPSETGITIKGNFSAWVKFATSNTEVALFGGFDSSGANDNDGYMVFKRTADGNLQFEGGDNVYLETTALFRDTSAWYHIVLAIDSSNATANNKQRIYVNGAEITAFDTRNNLTNLQDLPMNSTAGNDDRFLVGCDEDTGGRGLFFTGYMADVYWIDNNSQMAASDFGEYNDNGVWIPKDGSDISFGDKNSFKMEYGSSGNLGLDSSGLGNSLGDNAGLAATNQTTDTPTNNFATMNPLSLTASTFAEGNLKLTGDGGNYDNNVPTIAFDIATTNGWYMEVKLVSGATADSVIGICKTDDANLTVNATATAAGTAADAVGLRGDGQKKINSNNSSYGDSYTDGDIIGVLVKDGTIKFSKNGTIQNSGTAAATSLTGLYYIILAVNGSAVFEANFGNPSFAISSGNADANGYGNFEFAPPSGYYALCTKNLAEYG